LVNRLNRKEAKTTSQQPLSPMNIWRVWRTGCSKVFGWGVSQSATHCMSCRGISSVAILCFSSQITRTWYLVSNVLQTPVSNIIATRNGMNPLVDMMAAVFETKDSCCRQEECYRGTRRYISLALVSEQRGGRGDGGDR
jgi:hypothetical protein